MKVVFVCLDEPGADYLRELRCAVPARAINRTGKHRARLISLQRFVNRSPDARRACRAADVIVVQRGFSPQALPEIQHWKAHDKVVIADIDSACYSSPGVEALFSGQTAASLCLVDAVTAASPLMLDDWSRCTPAYHLPNFLEVEHYTPPARERRDEIVIGWSGGDDPGACFARSGLERALRRVCRARPNVRVMIYSPLLPERISLNLPDGQLICRPWTPYAGWPQALAEFDIGLAPLVGESDARRSWTRVLEYMLMKIPWVCSEGPAYQELQRYGWQVKNSAAAWERVLLDMVDHLQEYRREAAWEPYLYAINQNVDEHVDRILQVYTEIQSAPRAY